MASWIPASAGLKEVGARRARPGLWEHDPRKPTIEVITGSSCPVPSRSPSNANGMINVGKLRPTGSRKLTGIQRISHATITKTMVVYQRGPKGLV